MPIRAFAITAALLLTAPAFAQAPPAERQVSVSAIPGIVAAGAQWKTVWSGADDAEAP